MLEAAQSDRDLFNSTKHKAASNAASRRTDLPLALPLWVTTQLLDSPPMRVCGIVMLAEVAEDTGRTGRASLAYPQQYRQDLLYWGHEPGRCLRRQVAPRNRRSGRPFLQRRQRYRFVVRGPRQLPTPRRSPCCTAEFSVPARPRQTKVTRAAPHPATLSRSTQ